MTDLRLWLVPALFACAAGCTASLGDDATDSEADPDEATQQEVDNLVLDKADAPAGETSDALSGDDLDGDGIPDATEELLLRRYRPFYRFSESGDDDEDYRPADAIAVLS